MFSATITPDEGEPFELTAKSRDVVRWEKADPRRNSLGALESNTSMTAITALLFHAAVRQGLFAGDLEKWQDSVDVELHAPGDDEAGPTRSAR